MTVHQIGYNGHQWHTFYTNRLQYYLLVWNISSGLFVKKQWEKFWNIFINENELRIAELYLFPLDFPHGSTGSCTDHAQNARIISPLSIIWIVRWHSSRRAKTLYLLTPISIENDVIYSFVNESTDRGWSVSDFIVYRSIALWIFT